MYHKTVLPNGARLVTEYIPHVRSVSLGIWFESGSRNETIQLQGISHFMEHMMFKGSKRYSAKDIAEIMDTSGGHLNAFTGKEYTCYYARVLDEHLPIAVDVLQEMLLHSALAPDEVEKERGVILEEIKMYEDTPDELVHDLLSEALWVGHPLGLSILGTEESVGRIGREDLVHFQKTMYNSSNIVVALAGNVKHEEALLELEPFLSSFSPATEEPNLLPAAYRGENVFRQKDTEQIHVCVGGASIRRNDERKYTLALLDTILGGGVSSRLFQKLREERGLVYSTYSYHASYLDAGNFGVYAGCSDNHVDEVLGVIGEALRTLGQEAVSEEELLRSKGQLKGSLMLSLESTANRMMRLARGVISIGRPYSIDEVIASIDKVTREDILQLAEELFTTKPWTIAAVGRSMDRVDRWCRSL